MAKDPERREFLKYIVGGVAGLAIGIGAMSLYPRAPEMVTQTTTVTETGAATTVTQPANTAVATTAPATGGLYYASYPNTVDGMAALLGAAQGRLAQKLLTAAQNSSVDWKQFSKDVKSLNVAMRSSGDNDALMMVGKVFTQLTGINLTYEFTPELQSIEKIAVDTLSGTGIYDLPFIDNARVVKFAKTRTVEPLRKYIDDPKVTDKSFLQLDDVYPEDLKSANATPYGESGELYIMPQEHHCYMQSYRKDIFDQNGLTVADIDTIDKVKVTAAKLADPSKGFYGWVSRGLRRQNVYTWTSFFKGYGGQWFDEKWNPTLNNDAGIAAMTAYVDMQNNLGPPGDANWSFSEMYAAMSAGKLAMAYECDCMSTYEWSPSMATPEILGKVFSYLPAAGPVSRNAAYFAWDAGIPVGVKTQARKNAAWLLLELLSSPYGNALMNGVSMLFLPIHRSAWEMPEYAQIVPPNDYTKYKAIAQEEYAHYDDRPVFPEWPDCEDVIGIALSSALAKERTPKEALDWAAAQCKDILKAAGGYY